MKPDPFWEEGPRVRVDALVVGQRFVDINGTEWTRQRQIGSSGAYRALSVFGQQDCFAGCAEVRPIGKPGE